MQQLLFSEMILPNPAQEGPRTQKDGHQRGVANLGLKWNQFRWLFFLMSWPDQKGDVMYRFSWDSVQSCTSRLRRIFLWKNLGYTSFLGVYIQSNSMTTFQNTKKKCTENRVRHSELAPQKGARRGKLLRNWWWLWQELAPNVGSSKGVFLVAFRTFEVWKIKYGIFLPENKTCRIDVYLPCPSWNWTQPCDHSRHLRPVCMITRHVYSPSLSPQVQDYNSVRHWKTVEQTTWAYPNNEHQTGLWHDAL